MFRRSTNFLFIMIILASSLWAQTTTVRLSMDVFGVSPRAVAKSITDIYTYPSTGLKNVGIGSMVYFKATITGQKFVSPSWTITRKPSGATVAISTTKDIIDEYNQVVFLTADKLGAYEVTITDGSFTKSVTINASKYLGFENTIVNGVDTKLSCNICHSDKVTKWKGTAHSSKMTRGVTGQISGYKSTCIGCHNVGYDANPTAINDGFDDFPFTFPTVLAAGVFDQLKTQFPDAMKRANVQCESCHGPAGSHLGNTSDSRMQATYSANVCAYCHDSGTHHIFPEQWNASIHAVTTSYPTGAGRETCVRCHTAAGFAQFAKGTPTTDPYFDTSYSAISCAGCHDPHDASNAKQLRKVTAEILTYNSAAPTTPLNSVVENAGLGTMCINCHHARSEANQALASTISVRFGPHYGPQGDMLLSNNMLELGGVKLGISNHKGATVDACVRCHMYSLNALTGTKVNQWGGHSFSMSTFKKDAKGNFLLGVDGRRITDNDNMEACAQCHGGTFGTSFGDVKFFFNGNGDHDNNGVVEGLQDEVWGMINKVMTELGKIPGSTFSAEYGQWNKAGVFIPFPVPKSTWTKTQLSAYWNANTAYNDKSGGIHNPKYIVSALKGAMASLGIATSVNKYEETVPSEYVIYQNYPNPFNPTTNIKFALPKSGHVKLAIYDALGREVETLVNNELVAGTHNIEWTARNMASGIYLYRIEADNFIKVNKMLLVK